ncbi:membrane protein [Sulfurimicrobium lacus]|uniref:Membrane protein n=1 Tax=Sulfurimicrobium lacus TaxID=2715678 RepID=A0A6F8V7X5_9PROT|nr:stage II sporulation protein M [Sulfurimicrobium lacus]BCB25764.1 membrane protein [Sulfurimicrobium lacus]
MKERQFVHEKREEWEAWDRWLADRRRKRGEAPVIAPETLPRRFRALCQDLSLARDRRYSSYLLDELHARVLAAQQRIYGARRGGAAAWLRFLLHGLPVRVRAERRLVLASALLFFVPLLAVLALLQFQPEGVFFLMSPDSVGNFEAMYAPDARHLGRPRQAEDNVAALGFYIANNVRIDFQCFAGGMLFGLGSIFYLVYNGLIIGAVAGHLTHLGYIETFWGFVAGHSSLELLGVVLSGAAGLKLGLALVAPGRLRRVDALQVSGRGATELIVGAALLTFSAAFVEAFWSPLRSFPVEIKYVLGVAGWLALLAYLLLAGRERSGA